MQKNVQWNTNLTSGEKRTANSLDCYFVNYNQLHPSLLFDIRKEENLGLPKPIWHNDQTFITDYKLPFPNQKFPDGFYETYIFVYMYMY